MKVLTLEDSILAAKNGDITDDEALLPSASNEDSGLLGDREVENMGSTFFAFVDKRKKKSACQYCG